ncbi:hypothetical protein [Intrasporangium oryzae]|uniref:hypothetical protein n=1 Tax=Intrasporangium oryzae TaxID=412687 RepID=UPI0004B3214C|nr:hypothetical protein [Intrasporangium oryzae]
MATPTRDELPEIVRTVCDTHAALVDDALPGLLDGLYLHGSIGFDGEFHAGSDIDFVATVTRRPTDVDIEALRHVHAELGKRWPSPAYDGFYVLESDLAGRPADVPEGPGVLHEWFDVGHHGDVKEITWRELRDHGVTLRGRPLRDIEIHSDDAALHAATRDNLDTYWRAQLEAMEHHPREASLPQAAEWGALGAPRLHHLLVTGRPTSKSGGGRWVLEAFPHRREIAEEALRVRERPDEPSTYAADPDRRRRDLIALMSEVIADGVTRGSMPSAAASDR